MSQSSCGYRTDIQLKLFVSILASGECFFFSFSDGSPPGGGPNYEHERGGVENKLRFLRTTQNIQSN